MDQFLAELYGTNEPEAEDFEKVAHLDFLEKVAEEEGIDLNDLSDEDLEELAGIAAEALDDIDEEDGYEDEEDSEDDDDFEKEAEAKAEEADFLGRVMAHSFNQEMDMIEKEAGVREFAGKAARTATAPGRAFWRGVGRGASAINRGASKIRGASARAQLEGAKRGRRAAHKLAPKQMKRLEGAGAAMLESSDRGTRIKSRIDRGARRLGRALGAKSQAQGAREGARAGAAAGWAAPRQGGKARRAVDWMTWGKSRRAGMGAARGAAAGRSEALKSQRRRGYGAAAAGLGALGAGGAAAYMAGREKKSADEQWEDAVQARAWEHLMAAGLADDTGNFIPAEELDFGKTASDEDLEYNLDADALELLEAEGYPVQWY